MITGKDYQQWWFRNGREGEHEAVTAARFARHCVEQKQAEIDALKAQNAELLVAQQWRDIESAPRDGTWFLACSITKGWSAMRIVRFHRLEDSVPCNGEGVLWPSAPTHWQPLPPIPIAKVRGDL